MLAPGGDDVHHPHFRVHGGDDGDGAHVLHQLFQSNFQRGRNSGACSPS